MYIQLQYTAQKIQIQFASIFTLQPNTTPTKNIEQLRNISQTLDRETTATTTIVVVVVDPIRTYGSFWVELIGNRAQSASF